MGTKLPLVFNFSADGCTLDSPAQGAKDIPAQKSVAEDGTIKVTVAMIGATFEGKMEGDCINGTFAQGAMQLPLTLKRGAQEVRRPQTPVAPFPYKQEEVSFENAGFRFGGTLCTPANCTNDTPVGMPSKSFFSKLPNVFHPMCGTFRSGCEGKRRTWASNIFIHGVNAPAAAPSSESRHITCSPTQMPNTGWRSCLITGMSPLSCKLCIASAQLPTPGSNTWSAWQIVCSSAVT